MVGMICVEPDSKQDVLVLSENGYGKRTDLDEYRITNRGGKGVKTIIRLYIRGCPRAYPRGA